LGIEPDRWGSHNDGFSRQVERKVFVFATNTGSIGYSSRAVIVTMGPRGSLRWTPLSVPMVYSNGKIVARDAFMHLRWNDSLRALEVREYSDISPFGSAKYLYKVRSNETTLLRVEYSVGANEWKMVWEPGTFKLDGR
jgi:hypothetical protein